MEAGGELLRLAGLTHQRPPFAINEVRIDGVACPVEEVTTARTPFCTLLHFRKAGARPQPKVLLVAPLSGHFATLLRGTVRTLLPDHEVYITDWHNIRDVPQTEGSFGLDAFVDHLLEFLRLLGPASHVVAVCQPCVAALAAVALLAEDGDPCCPASMTLMAGPIDTRVNPTRVNDLAKKHPLPWFRSNLIHPIPQGHGGAGQLVYPGFLQLYSFMSMNPQRHQQAFVDLLCHRLRGEVDEAQAISDFYEEYFAVMDLPAEFFLETVATVFQTHDLPRGELHWRGRRVNPAAIRRTALLTIEGERDDICSVGQTMAAQDLCTGLRAYRKLHHLQPGAGHYGVFSGRRWETRIYPVLREFIQMSN